MKVLITGARGFLGAHLVKEISKIPNITLLTYCRDDEKQNLFTKLTEADFIFHLAGVNRSSNKNDFITSNVNLTFDIVDFLHKKNIKTPIYFSSSVHSGCNSEYGESKLKAENLLLCLESIGSRVTIDRLVRIFGPGAKPNYNSVVATLCYSVANDINFKIYNGEKLIEIAYVEDWARAVSNLILNHEQNISYKKYRITVGELVKLIISFKNEKKNSFLLDDQLTSKLLKTYLTYRNIIIS